MRSHPDACFFLFFQKPLIVSVPQTDSAWNLGDIMKKIGADNSTKGLQTNMSKNTFSKSTLDLSSSRTETLQKSQSQANVRQSRFFNYLLCTSMYWFHS